jgi:transposase
VPRKRGQRRPGKQPGAQGRHLAQVATPDEVVVHAPQTCQGCGGDLGGAEVVEQTRRQVFDLPQIRLRVVEHRAQRRCCPGCGQVTTAAFPAAATAPACYGPGVRAGIAYLCVAQHLPVERAAQTLSDLLGAPIAAGTIANVVGQAADAVGVAVEVIAAQVAAAEVAHFDETGVRVAGRGHWVHSASTSMLSYFTVHPKRGRQAMDAAGVLADFKGVAVHDGWRSYRGYDVTHGLCNAHHLRELQAIAEQGEHQDWAGYLIDTLVSAHRAVVGAKADGQQRLPDGLASAIRARYLGHVTQGRQANPRNPDSRKQTDAVNLLDRLEGYVDDVLRFTVDFGVPFDNKAERDIRMVKLQQKVSGGWRTLPGAQAFMAVRSYIATARKRGVNVLHVLRRAFEGDPWLPAATGPPASLAAAA